MIRKFSIKWKENHNEGYIHVSNGTIVNMKVARGDGSVIEADSAFTASVSCRLELAVEISEDPQADPAIVMVDSLVNPFSFFLRDVNQSYPIYIPAYGVVVTTTEDERSYSQIEQYVQGLGQLTTLEAINEEPEESYEEAARNTRDNPGQTWLGLSRDMRVFGVGFRGIGGEERLWDWVQPRFHGMETTLPENEDKPVRYRFLLGRGIGCKEDIKRRLEEGILPILHADITDNDIVYQSTSFVSYEYSKLSSETLRGTSYLVADGYGQGHMLTPEQEKQRNEQLPEEMNQQEETVFYFRCKATNKAKVPRYAWFKNVVPNAFVFNNTSNYEFDGKTGFVKYSAERICSVSKLNGKPLSNEETAILIHPGETAEFEFYLPHRPISQERAEKLRNQSFTERLEECIAFWHNKLNAAANIKLPEPRLNEMVKAGLLHLDLISYGLEPEGTIVPAIGTYTAIGSESSPIIQFIDSMGLSDIAKRSLMFFLDKQHDNGFIQNFGGYMLETGATLWSIGEHYRYTRDEAWIAEIKPKLLKAYEYLLAWRERNLKEELRGNGYGMLEGKTADPEDLFRSFMLNGYAYIGISRLAELFQTTDPTLSAQINEQREALKLDIRTAFFGAVSRSPVIPLGDGSWIPTAPPWVEHRGPLALYSESSARWLTHGSFVVRDSLLGPLYLVLQEVLQPNERETDFLLNFHNELMCMENVALSQPYYSIHPWVHLKRGEVKPFLKAYYNGFTGLADRETYTFWEHHWQASPHKTHEEGWFLMQTRWMLYMEEGETLKLLPGIPRNWLEDGKIIELNEVASYFGRITLSVESQLEQGKITAKVSCKSDRMPKSVELRIPHPDGLKPVSVDGGTYDPINETVCVNGFNGTSEISLHF